MVELSEWEWIYLLGEQCVRSVVWVAWAWRGCGGVGGLVVMGNIVR